MSELVRSFPVEVGVGALLLLIVCLPLYWWLGRRADARRSGKHERVKSGLPHLVLVLLAFAVSETSAQEVYNVLPMVNQHRTREGYNTLTERRDLQMAAERSVRLQAAGGFGHKGTVLSGTVEGVGMRPIRDPSGSQFYACYHVYRARGKPPASRSHVYGGAAVAVVGNRTYYALLLDSDGSAGSPRRSVGHVTRRSVQAVRSPFRAFRGRLRARRIGR